MRSHNLRSLLILLLLSISMVAPPSEAAISVIEVGPNLAANQTSAIQNTITAIQAVIIVANQVLELTALEGILGLDGELSTLSEIIQQGMILETNLGEILGFFDVANAPDTSRDLNLLAAEMRVRIGQAFGLSLESQRIIRTALVSLGHILEIISHAGGAIGNLSISQSISEAQSKLQQILLEGNVRQTIFERAKSLEGAAPQVLIESVHRINERRMADHPR